MLDTENTNAPHKTFFAPGLLRSILLIACGLSSGCSCSADEPPEHSSRRDDPVEATGCAPPDERDPVRAGVDLRTACVSGVVALSHEIDFFPFARVYDDVAGWYWTFDDELVQVGSGYELHTGPYAATYLPDGQGAFVPAPADGSRLVAAGPGEFTLDAMDERRVFRTIAGRALLVRVELLGGPDGDNPAVLRAVDLARDPQDGSVQSLTDSAGRTVTIQTAGGAPVAVSGPTAIDSWSVSTAPTPDGGWATTIGTPGPSGASMSHVFVESAGRLAAVVFPDGTSVAYERPIAGGQVRQVKSVDAAATVRAAFNVLACDSSSQRTVLLGDPGGPPSIPYVNRLEYPIVAPDTPGRRLARSITPTGRWVAYGYTGPTGDVSSMMSRTGQGMQIDYHPGTRTPATVTMLPGGRVIYTSSALAEPTLLPTSITLDDGRTVVRSYDALGRLLSSQVGAETTTVTRTAIGAGTRTCAWLTNTATGVYQQNLGCMDETFRGRVVAVDWASGHTGIVRDPANGLPTSITTPGGDITSWGYAEELTTTVAQSGAPTTTYGYSAGFLSSTARAASSTTYQYTDWGALASADAAVASAQASASLTWTPDRYGLDLRVNGALVQSPRGHTAPPPPPLSCGSL